MTEKHAVATSPVVEPKEWVIELKRDSPADKPSFEATLVFKLDAQNEILRGQVWDGVNGHLLSTVIGTIKRVPGAEESSMELEFKWGKVNVMLEGQAVEALDTVHFKGRYRASASTAAKSNHKGGHVDAVALMEPSDGDTGSGTGQQT